MDIVTERIRNSNPREKSNFFSILFFTYTLNVFKKGYKKTLEIDDLYDPLSSDRSKWLGDKMERNWLRELENSKKFKKKPNLLKVIAKTFWYQYFILGVLVFIMDLIIRIVQPIMLGNMLDYFNPNSTTTKFEALWYTGAIILFTLTTAILLNQFMMETFHVGMKIRASCCALIYRKALRLSKTALGDTASGKIVNLLSNDVSRFDMVSIFIHSMWSGPISTLIVTALLYRSVGWPGLVGILVVFTVVPLQSYTGKLSAKYRKQTALKTDERVRLMDEIITGIQVIKMYAWEKPFEKIIKFARKNEIKIITKSSYVRGMFMTFTLFTTRFALFCTLLAMVFTNQLITASKVFIFMSYYNTISMGMGTMFARGISEIAEVLVAIKRIQNFLLNEEYSTNNDINDDDDDLIIKNNKINSLDVISIQNLTVKYNISYTENALEDINFNIKQGELVGVIGPVGSGKSTLLNTILKELETIKGTININGTISYASQEPWVFAANIRQNITFCCDYDKKRYLEVVKCCALERDFQQFPDGDLTIVGDRGASLSGGQKARINLARAIYRNADVYLLDDPLSAVDIHVSKKLYEDCINGFLRDKTRILVTHQVHYLKNCNHIIILNNGRIETEGTFRELAEGDNIYAKLLIAEKEGVDGAEGGERKTESTRRSRHTSKGSTRKRRSSLNSLMSELSFMGSINFTDDDTDNEEDEEETQNAKVYVKDMQEESSKGKIKGSKLLKYLHSGGSWCKVITVLSLFILTQLSASLVDYWVSYWVNIEEFKTQNNGSFVISNNVANNSFMIPLIDLTTSQCLIIYGSIIAMLLITASTRSAMFYRLAMESSRKLHQMIFSGVITAPMRFFETNPSGRILNRFSKDIGSVDEMLPKVVLDASQFLLLMTGSVILVIIVNPYFLILIVILGVLFGYIRHVYLKTSKNIKRLEGMMRSPVFTHLNATLQGLTTIRAFGAQEVLSKEFDQHQDYHTSAWFSFVATSSAFGFYLDLFCTFFLAFISFSFLTFGESFGISGGNVGLAITQASALTMLLQFSMRQSAEVSNQLMSVERVLEYNQLPKETQPEKPKKIDKTWPDKGEIVLENMGLKYFEGGDLVLKNMNLVINPNEKVGVVGRTGAGKSSLIAALFRLAPVEGSIKIDGVDTKEIQLQNLRSKISIIPQDPVLFSGTLRYNLDPFDEYSDDVLYKAINEVELNDPSNIINRLENRVMDRGSNYSVGQRQLICLARAIIRNNKILMLDEATANIDPQTDALIQKTIRKKFVDCTVITVAHRLNTIMDSDKILVMDFGTVLEYDHPHNLLQNKNGAFYKMVMETGQNLAEQLKKIALDRYQKQLSVPE